MIIAPNTALREIVTDNPAAADLFDVLDIDYFCRGSRLLCDALREHSVSLDAFAGELARVDQRPLVPDWRMATLRALIGHIVDIYHERLRRELPALDEAIHRLDSQPASSNRLLKNGLGRNSAFFLFLLPNSEVHSVEGPT
jgi:iron-sulfur cluster repair protein YtfE (RIC family)